MSEKEVDHGVKLFNNNRRGAQEVQATCNGSLGTLLIDLPSPHLASIMSRLPMKSLFMCKCVCKSFLSVISDPCSVNILSPAVLFHTPCGFFCLDELTTKNDKCIGWPIKFKPGVNLPNVKLYFVGACEGLLCFCDRRHGDSTAMCNNWVCLCDSMHPKDTIYICNPLTREYVMLPERNYHEHCPVVYGFGFCTTTKKYKILRIEGNRWWCNNKVEVEIFTLGEETWRPLGIKPFRHDSTISVYNLNGALHWLDNGYIHAFDLAQECLRCIPMPDSNDSMYECMRLQVIAGFLSIIDDHRDWFDMWSMKDYGVESSWSQLRIMKEYERCFHQPVVSWKNGDIFFGIEYGKEQRGLELFLCYDPKASKSRDAKIHRTSSSGVGKKAYSYIPSLIKLEDIFKGNLPIIMKLR